MSGHTNRNRRNGGNSRSRNNSQRQRGGDGRAGQPKNNAPPSREAKMEGERKPEPGQENPRLQRGQQSPQSPQSPAAGQQPPAQSDVRQSAAPSDESPTNPAPSERPERPERPERQGDANPRSRPPFAAAMRGQAYIPANTGNSARPGQNGQNGQGAHVGQNGQNGQNGHGGPNGQSGQSSQNGRQSANGHLPADRRNERPVVWSRDDEGDDEGAGEIPATWRAERLNGGTDTTPHEPFRPESRGEVGPLIDTLHELFSQDRAMASRGDSARCGICYLHFPLTALEHREDEGFYVCEGCRRLLGHQRLTMVRRQQAPGA